VTVWTVSHSKGGGIMDKLSLILILFILVAIKEVIKYIKK